MADVGKEPQHHIIHFFLMLSSSPNLPHLLSEFLATVIIAITEVAEKCHDDEIQTICPACGPYRRIYLYIQENDFLIFMMIDVLLLQQQFVFTRWKVGQRDDMIFHRQPLLVQSFQLIFIGTELIHFQSLRMALYHEIVFIMLQVQVFQIR